MLPRLRPPARRGFPLWTKNIREQTVRDLYDIAVPHAGLFLPCSARLQLAYSWRSRKALFLLGFLVTPTGFEPVTCPLGGGCSIQLSHGATRPSYLDRSPLS